MNSYRRCHRWAEHINKPTSPVDIVHSLALFIFSNYFLTHLQQAVAKLFRLSIKTTSKWKAVWRSRNSFQKKVGRLHSNSNDFVRSSPLAPSFSLANVEIAMKAAQSHRYCTMPGLYIEIETSSLRDIFPKSTHELCPVWQASVFGNVMLDFRKLIQIKSN